MSSHVKAVDGRLQWLNELALRRVDAEGPAGLWITSLPWPPAEPRNLALNGRPTYARPLGQWPGASGEAPRRLLLIADGEGEAPDEVRLAPPTGESAAEPPAAHCELLARSDDPDYIWERHRLRIEHQGRTLKLAMGLRTAGDAVHWWEACRLVELEHTPTCRVIEMAGAIPLVHSTRTYGDGSDDDRKFLHKHNWLYGHVRMRLHANGVCEVFAHHINSMYVDAGADLHPAVPVVGLWTDGLEEPAVRDLHGAWDGSRTQFDLGEVSFDASDVAPLATPDEPGRIDMDRDTDMLVWQPYLGCSWFGGHKLGPDGGYLVRGHEQKIPRGMARTLRFSVSLSDRSPRVVRYMAPAWWYALCEEFQPAPLLPVFSAPERLVEAGRKWVRGAITNGGFEDGALDRGGVRDQPDERGDPGWEGEIPYAQFLAAWRYTDGADHALAMRTTYHFADVAIDHTHKLVRCKGFDPPAFVMPMNRVQGLIAGFLETGDDYLLETAEAVVESAHRVHRNAWPRLAVGRDAMFGRSAMLLYRYFDNDHFRRIAHRCALDVAEVQRDNGSFGDQGGGAGLHQWPSYITKPWMALLATNCVLDYLEMFPDEPVLVETVRRLADWLLGERVERDGVMTWAYQHDYDGQRRFLVRRGEHQTLPSPKGQWHHETLARLLGYAALRFNEPVYLDAWAESHAAVRDIRMDHTAAAAFQFLPWLQAGLWQTTLDDDGQLRVHAVHFGPRTFGAATALTPHGEVELRWAGDDRIETPADAETTTHDWSGDTTLAATRS